MEKGSYREVEYLMFYRDMELTSSSVQLLISFPQKNPAPPHMSTNQSFPEKTIWWIFLFLTPLILGSWLIPGMKNLSDRKKPYDDTRDFPIFITKVQMEKKILLGFSPDDLLMAEWKEEKVSDDILFPLYVCDAGGGEK